MIRYPKRSSRCSSSWIHREEFLLGYWMSWCWRYLPRIPRTLGTIRRLRVQLAFVFCGNWMELAAGIQPWTCEEYHYWDSKNLWSANKHCVEAATTPWEGSLEQVGPLGAGAAPHFSVMVVPKVAALMTCHGAAAKPAGTSMFHDAFIWVAKYVGFSGFTPKQHQVTTSIGKINHWILGSPIIRQSHLEFDFCSEEITWWSDFCGRGRSKLFISDGVSLYDQKGIPTNAADRHLQTGQPTDWKCWLRFTLAVLQKWAGQY